MPPTMQCDYGSVEWRLKATVHRPGPFTPKLSASREVILVASPSEDDRDDADNITIERHWEDQMQYMLTVSGRVFPIGGTVPITLTFMPMAKVKIFELSVQLEGNSNCRPSPITTYSTRQSGWITSLPFRQRRAARIPNDASSFSPSKPRMKTFHFSHSRTW